MPKFIYTGDDVHNLACVGTVVPGKPFNVTKEQGEALEEHAPELYERVTDEQAAKILAQMRSGTGSGGTKPQA